MDCAVQIVMASRTVPCHQIANMSINYKSPEVLVQDRTEEPNQKPSHIRTENCHDVK
jgi:hypothetical protein